jgi:5'-nucleotidase
MDSTPADCVRFGINGLGERYDLVLSGINRGVNLGVDMIYSGTVAAIFEAAYWDHRALAFSTYPDNRDGAASMLDRVWQYVNEKKLFEHNPIWNVNVPYEPKGMRITKQGTPYFTDGFKLVDEEHDMYVQTGEMIPDACPTDMERDTVAVVNGYISLTPLTLSRTAKDVFDRLKDEV